MINETIVLLNMEELTAINIMMTRFLNAEKAGCKHPFYMTEHTRQIWLTACDSIARKTDNAIAYCEDTKAFCL